MANFSLLVHVAAVPAIGQLLTLCPSLSSWVKGVEAPLDAPYLLPPGGRSLSHQCNRFAIPTPPVKPQFSRRR